jgi:protein-S-isoprenylcysteine O-methyltransferase Ste14
MDALNTKVPPLALLALFMLVNFLLIQQFDVARSDQLFWTIAAAAVLLFGIFCCVAGVVSFRHARTTVDPRNPEQSAALVSSGIYRITRNPMYVGFSLILLAQSLYLQSLIGIIISALFMAYLQRFQIKPEERALRALFGEAYITYCQRVRRWL